MPNTQTSVPVFTSGQVLTAQQQTEINTGIPVFATTVTRDAAFGGAGEKVLAEGQFAYIEATNTTQYYDGAAWQAVGASGLTLISATTIGTTVSSVTVSSAFSATYDNYLITVNGGTSSNGNTYLRMTLGATVTGYYYGELFRSYAGVTGAGNLSNGDHWFAGGAKTNGLIMNMELQNPFLSARTIFNFNFANPTTTGEAEFAAGFLDNATSYTAFTLAPNAGTITGGTIRVYGYANS
jgi:hypothetical protein